MSAWWHGLARAVAVVECDGAAHRLAWERGSLVTLDHSDPEGERALVALGGKPCACIDIVEAWERHRSSVDVVLVASRGPGDLPASEDYPGHKIEERDAELRRLLRLGGALPERLVANVVSSLPPEAPGPLLHAALYGRVLVAVRQWLGRPEARVELEYLAPGEPRCLAYEGNTVKVALPFTWLSDVWVRGFT